MAVKISKTDGGQIMLLTVLLLGGAILGATTIAGYLMLQKIRIAADITNSTKAIFAADTGIEWELYRKFKDTNHEKPNLSNGASFNTVVNEDGSTMKSIGSAGRSVRAFEVRFAKTTSTSP